MSKLYTFARTETKMGEHDHRLRGGGEVLGCQIPGVQNRSGPHQAEGENLEHLTRQRRPRCLQEAKS